MSPIRTSAKRRSILKHRASAGSSPPTLARTGSDASPNRALPTTPELANSPSSSSAASSSTTGTAGGECSTKRSVQFSPNTSLTSVFETHAPDVYDRKPIAPSPLTAEELEHAPAWFNLTLSSAGPRSSSRPVLSPQRTRPRSLARINCNESRMPLPASPRAAMQFDAENVILEEEEEDDVALPQSPTTSIPFPSAPFASLPPRPLSQSAPTRGRVLTSNTAHNLSHHKRWPAVTALRVRQPNVVAGNNARDLGRAATDKETNLFSAPSGATESKALLGRKRPASLRLAPPLRQENMKR